MTWGGRIAYRITNALMGFVTYVSMSDWRFRRPVIRALLPIVNVAHATMLRLIKPRVSHANQ